MAKLARWVCPNCQNGALAPRKPRKDDVRRYCLGCSEKTGRLVLKICPALEKKRETKYERERAKRRKNYRWTAPTGYYQLLPTHHALSWWQNMQAAGELRVRRTKHLGPAKTRWEGKVLTVTLNVPKDADVQDVEAAIVVGAGRAYTANMYGGPLRPAPESYVRRMIRYYCERHLSVRPRLDSLRKAEEEVAELLRAKQAHKNLTSSSIMERVS